MQSDAIDQNAARSPTIAASCETKAAPIRHNAAFFRKWSTLFENNEGQSETSDESLEMASTALARRGSSASFWIEAGEPAFAIPGTRHTLDQMDSEFVGRETSGPRTKRKSSPLT